MRHISTITAKEGTSLWNAIMPKFTVPFTGTAYKLKTSDTAPERVVLMQGVERLGIQFDGHIWADCDLSPIELDKQKVTEYLESIGISL